MCRDLSRGGEEFKTWDSVGFSGYFCYVAMTEQTFCNDQCEKKALT